jgi:hypothetical protein
MTRRRLLTALDLFLIFCLALTVFLWLCTDIGEESQQQTQDQIFWSGQTWQVRPPGVGLPGPNRWDNSTDTVKINDDGSLELSIVKKNGKWVSGEISNVKALGYGTYRWEIASDLSATDPSNVLGLFTYDMENKLTHREIDIEATRWSNAQSQNGWIAYWLSGTKQFRRGFEFTNQPPYQAQFIWRPGQISYYVSDRTGKALVDLSFTELIPQPGQEVATVNFWRFKGKEPMRKQSVRITKFTWEPLPKES